MSADLIEIVHDLRKQLGHKGGATLSSLALAFQVNDVNGNGNFNFTDFEQVLGKVGLFARRQELTKLYRYFDKTGTEQLNYREFLRVLQGEVNARRMAIIRLVWDKLSCGRDTIQVKLVIGAYSAKDNRRVLSGEKAPEQIFREFATNFENAGNVDGNVSWQQFADFYCAISASVPYDDDYFVDELERAWGVKEITASPPVPTALVRKVENVIREKIRQRSKYEGREMEELRLTFKHFDLEEAGTIDYTNFLRALERFGINLSPQLAEGLYADFAAADNRINYAEFVAALFHGEALTPSYKGITRTVPGQAGPDKTVVFVMGGPSSGAGAFCSRVREEFGYVHLCPDDLVENEKVSGGDLAMKIPTSGKPVPSALRMQLLSRAMDKFASQGKTNFVFEGFPSSPMDMEAWDMAANKTGGPVLAAAILLDLVDELMIQRMSVTDSKRLTIDARMSTYKNLMLPVVGDITRRNVLHKINGDAPEHQVYGQIQSIISSMQTETAF